MRHSPKGDDVLTYQRSSCVPDVEKSNSRTSPWFLLFYTFGYHQTYHDLREVYWWDGLKGTLEFVSKCLNCKQVKAQHLIPNGLTQIMDVPTWKLDSLEPGAKLI